MNTRQRIRPEILLGIVALAVLVLGTVPAQVVAFDYSDCALYPSPTPCSPGMPDDDGDGLSDCEECQGIQLCDETNGCMSLPPTGVIIESCAKNNPIDCSNPSIRPDTLDPNSPDLFVILVRKDPAISNIPPTGPTFDPLEFVSADPPEGLGITTHEIVTNQAGVAGTDFPRRVTVAQNAVKVTESLLHYANGDKVGEATWSTPNGTDRAIVYTQRIHEFIDLKCQNATVCCKDVLGIVRPELYLLYIKHTIAHEVGHMIKLTKDFTEKFDGNHYKPGQGTIMEQSVAVGSKQGGKAVTFYISDHYAWSADYYDKILK